MSASGRDIRFAGNTVHVGWDGEEAESLVNFLFGDIEEDTANPLSQTLVQFTVSSADSGKMMQVISTEGDNLQSGLQEVANFLVERVTYHIADRSSGGVLLHAACMAKVDKGLVLPGVSGTGKSTLAFWLEQQGYSFLTDELVFIPEGTLECQGLARPINLKNISAEMFGDLSPGQVLGENELNNQPAYRKFVLSKAIVSTTCLHSIVFPFYKKDSCFQFQRLSGAETALALTGSLVNARNLPDNGFPELLRIARIIPGYRLEYPNFDKVPEAFSKILQKP